MKYKAIIFDCDGVLVDSESITMNVFIELFSAYGVEMSYDYAIKTLTGKAFDQIVEYVEEEYQITLNEDFEKQFRQKTFEAFKNDIQPIDGIKEVVSQLKIPFAVASNGPMSKMELNLKTTGLYPYFEGNMFSAYDLQAWKPDPKVFVTTAQHLGMQPSDCVVIEDSMSGVVAAQNGGFDVMVYVGHQEEEKYTSKGIKVFKDMKELLILID
ncbi:HAD family phosphatase [Flammeovirga sp. SJP92]|uniref:HAD family hydrolase n=1 Tax=Flammeovirga sp. SJP92 TaxID=1775430 RepID=UPI000787BCB8|nr:HAD-IA family hydrolase [Flammeovirga sp. SJP92]KXX71460.1 hypothetical protein AVL50_06035 [Flammeovirga sp. SJP92]